MAWQVDSLAVVDSYLAGLEHWRLRINPADSASSCQCSIQSPREMVNSARVELSSEMCEKELNVLSRITGSYVCVYCLSQVFIKLLFFSLHLLQLPHFLFDFVRRGATLHRLLQRLQLP